MISVSMQTPLFNFVGPVRFGTNVGQMRGRSFPEEEFTAMVNGDVVSDEFIFSEGDYCVLLTKVGTS